MYETVPPEFFYGADSTVFQCGACGFSSPFQSALLMHECPPVLTAAEYPVLARIWDNPEDDKAYGSL